MTHAAFLRLLLSLDVPLPATSTSELVSVSPLWQQQILGSPHYLLPSCEYLRPSMSRSTDGSTQQQQQKKIHIHTLAHTHAPWLKHEREGGWGFKIPFEGPFSDQKTHSFSSGCHFSVEPGAGTVFTNTRASSYSNRVRQRLVEFGYFHRILDWKHRRVHSVCKFPFTAYGIFCRIIWVCFLMYLMVSHLVPYTTVKLCATANILTGTR